MKGVWLCPVIAVSLGCAGPMQGLYPPEEGEPGKVVYVVSHGWHTGIVIRRADIAEGIWPEPHDFVDAEHVEVGWGDRDFYLAPEATSGLALKAAFWPTTSVLHVVGFAVPVEQFFRGHEMIKVRLSAPGLDRLAAFIREAFARDEAGRAIRLGPGQHPNSRFYLGRETYHLLNTCNRWTARALRSAGAPITPVYAVTAGNVMYQGRRFGRLIGTRH